MQLTTEELCARAASPRHGEASQSAEKESEKVEFQSDASNASETTLPSPGGANKHRISHILQELERDPDVHDRHWGDASTNTSTWILKNRNNIFKFLFFKCFLCNVND
jgi:hypothetical protein